MGRIGQPHGGMTGQILDQRDVGVREGGMVGTAADGKHPTQRAAMSGVINNRPQGYTATMSRSRCVLDVRAIRAAASRTHRGSSGDEGGIDGPRPESRDRLAAQVGELDAQPARCGRSRSAAAHVRVRQEDQAEAGQALHDQLAA